MISDIIRQVMFVNDTFDVFWWLILNLTQLQLFTNTHF